MCLLILMHHNDYMSHSISQTNVIINVFSDKNKSQLSLAGNRICHLSDLRPTQPSLGTAKN